MNKKEVQKIICAVSACGLMISACAPSAFAADIQASEVTPSVVQAATISQGQYLVDVSLWKAAADEASMGAVSMKNNAQALVTVSADTVTVQMATNPVSVSGYESGIQGMLYDTNGNGTYNPVTTVETGTITTGTKFDGTSHTFSYLSIFSIELPSYVSTSDAISYIPVKIQVPYTPMDVVAVGDDGYLDARLRLDWSTVVETSQTKLTPNTAVATGTSSLTGEDIEDITLTDSATGIVLISTTETVSRDVTMQVQKTTSGNTYEQALTAVGNNNFTLYEISLTQNGTSFELDGSVSVSFPTTSSSLEIYRINTAGGKTKLTGAVSGGMYTVSTSQIGAFAVIGDVMSVSAPDYEGHWAQSYIENVLGKELVDLTGANTYAPNVNVTRRVFVTGLARMSDVQVQNTKTIFTDVAATDADSAYIAWANENGIVNGKGDNLFAPDASITREEMATMLYRYMQFTGKTASGQSISFADAGSISSWAKDAVDAVSAAGLIEGKTDNKFDPSNTATRAEYATILSRLLSLYGK